MIKNLEFSKERREIRVKEYILKSKGTFILKTMLAFIQIKREYKVKGVHSSGYLLYMFWQILCLGVWFGQQQEGTQSIEFILKVLWFSFAWKIEVDLTRSMLGNPDHNIG